MDLRTTIWSAPALLMVITFPAAVILVARLLMPRQVTPLSRFPEAQRARVRAGRATGGCRRRTGRPAASPPGSSAARSSPACSRRPVRVALSPLRDQESDSLDLNAMNTMLLVVAFVLYRNVASFTKAIRAAVSVCWPVLVLYHLYGGVAGLLQYTSVGERFAGAFAAWATPLTFPLLTAAASAIVSIFIPSSGGQWVVQGFVTSRAAAEVGTDRAARPAGVERRGPCRQPGVALLAGAARRDCAGGLPHVLRLRRDLRPALVRARRRPRYLCSARMTALPLESVSPGG